MAIPGIVGTNGGGRNGNGSFSVTPPVGAAGYLAVASWGGSTTGLTPPSGWTLVSRGQGPSDNYSQWGIWVGTASAGSSWTLASASGFAVALVIGGYDGAITVDDWDRNGSSGTSSIPACPASTATEPGLVVRAAMIQNFSGTATISYPTAATDGRVFHTQTPGERWTAAISHHQQASAGSTGTAQYGIGSATPWDAHAATIVINAEADETPQEERTGSAGMTLAGSASVSQVQPRTGFEGMALAGSAAAVPQVARTGSASLSLHGAAVGGPYAEVTGSATLTLSATASPGTARTGGAEMTLVGSATRSVRVAATGAATLTLAGEGEQTNHLVAHGTATMTLDATAEAGVDATARTAVGNLTLLTTAVASVRAVTAASGALTLTASAEGTAIVTYIVFVPPLVDGGRVSLKGMPFERIRSYASVHLIRENGIYRVAQEISDEEIAGAEKVYLGGHRHTLTDDEVDDLTNAGYGDWIYEVEEAVDL